jgi:hypothetical protein
LLDAVAIGRFPKIFNQLEKNHMKLFKTAPMISWIVLLGAMLNPVAKADEWNKKTIVKLSGPVEIPGVHLVGWGVLPAGTYVFKLLDSSSNRHIVQIFSEDERTVYATILAIPNYRLQATDKTVITFAERPAGQPEALRAWFYPGRNWGEEFVYPKTQAIALAKQSKMPVLFTAEELPVEVAQLAQVVTAPPPEVAQSPAPSGNTTANSSSVPAQRLPDTAGTLPLYALAGLASFGAASIVRAYSKRSR